jgi:hypothetical protein
MAELDHYQGLARALVDGKKLILPGGVLARSGARAAAMRVLGAERPFLLASGAGTGPQPTTDEAAMFSLDVDADSVITEIRETDRLLSDLPAAAVAAIDDYDPGCEAIVLGGPLVSATDVAGRPVIGRRPAAWAALEDKVVCDDVWDAAGVKRAEYEVVPTDAVALEAASRRLDRGDGTVWAGDASEGFNGGADYVRWVRRSSDIDEAVAFFAAHCRRVRVMPFLEGIPTSIHGFAHGGEVAVFRPVELITLRTPTNRFRYAGTTTYWDPEPEDRDDMRDAARRVGHHIAERVGYRGGFTVDGVMTADGFRPTELNARFGAGMTGVLGTIAFPLQLIQTIAVEDADAELYPADIERILLEHADANRAGTTYTVISQKIRETVSHAVVDRGDAFTFAGDDGHATGTLLVGPSGVGGLVSYAPEASRVPVGGSFAPVAVRAYAFADEHLATELGPLEAPRAVR